MAISRLPPALAKPGKKRGRKGVGHRLFENAQSRIYLGIHWAFDRDDGIRTGDDVADFVFDNALRPKHGGRAVFFAAPLASAREMDNWGEIKGTQTNGIKLRRNRSRHND